MGDKILVTFATWAGSTGEVAQAIGKTLADEGTPVDVRPASEVDDVSAYRAVVLGSAIRAGQLHPQAVAFLNAHQTTLSQIPVAYFVVCLTMKEDTEENRCMVEGYLKPLLERFPDVQPVSMGLLAGAVDLEKIPFIMRLILKLRKVPAGDFRDWEAIRAWANQIRPKLEN